MNIYGEHTHTHTHTHVNTLKDYCGINTWLIYDVFFVSMKDIWIICISGHMCSYSILQASQELYFSGSFGKRLAIVWTGKLAILLQALLMSLWDLHFHNLKNNLSLYCLCRIIFLSTTGKCKEAICYQKHTQCTIYSLKLDEISCLSYKCYSFEEKNRQNQYKY